MARTNLARTKIGRFITSHTPEVLIAPEVQQKIADIAYFLYEDRGKEPGHDLEDWLEAERIVLGRKKKGKSVPAR